MCTCTSCKYTDSFSGWPNVEPGDNKGGFENWPRGDPAGKRLSDAAYRSHVAHAATWGRRMDGNMSHGAEFTASELKGTSAGNAGGPRYVRPKGCFPGPLDAEAGLTAYISAFEYLNCLKSQGPDLPAPARPAPACKPVQHFPVADRGARASARIYRMPQVKADPKAKRPVGRTPLDGVKRIAVSLDNASIERARKLGGNVSAGIRAALKAQASG